MQALGQVLGWMFCAIFVLGWTAATLTFDAMMVRSFVQQARSQRWPTAAGRIVSAEVQTQHDSESGTSYKPKISYAYSVNGATHRSDRIRHRMNHSDSKSARRTVELYRAGRDVTVHFNPDKPSEAVLETNVLSGADLFMAIFMLPFNLVMLAGWIITRGVIRNALTHDPPPPAGHGVKLIEEPSGVRVRLIYGTPLSFAGIVAACTAFALVFIIAFIFGMNSMNAAAAGWAVILAAAVFAYRWKRDRINSGYDDLMIDVNRRVVTLPRTLGRKESLEVPLDDVTAVEMVTKHGTGDDSDSFRPTLHWAQSQSAALADMSVRESAEALVSWLRQRLRLTERTAAAPGGEITSASPSTAG